MNRDFPHPRKICKRISDCCGLLSIEKVDGDIEVIPQKEAWKRGFICWVDLHFHKSGSCWAAWDLIFTRWVRLKKEATSSEVEGFFLLMQARIPQGSGHWDRHFMIKKGGVYFNQETKTWENKTTSICRICGKQSPNTQDFCHYHQRAFQRFLDRKKLNRWEENTEELFIEFLIRKRVKLIERGKVQWG